MEEQFKPSQLRPDTELVAEINKEYTLKGYMRKQPGLILFAVNLGEDTVTRVKIHSELVVGMDRKVTKKNKAYFDPNVIYVWAINEKRAMYKVRRDFINFITRKEERNNGSN